MLLLNGLHSNFAWMISCMLHRAPLTYVDVPAESTVDLRGLTHTLVKKKERKKKNLQLFQLYTSKRRTSWNPPQIRDSYVKRDSEWERERGLKKRFSSSSRLRSAAHWAGRRTVFPNTSQDVSPSSLETPRQRLNWDPDIKRLSGIVERRRHRTLYLPECGRNGAFALPVCSLHRVCLLASFEYTLVQTIPQTLRRVERRDVIGSSAQNSVGPATSRPVLAVGPVHRTPFGSSESRKKMRYRSKCDHCKNSYAHPT